MSVRVNRTAVAMIVLGILAASAWAELGDVIFEQKISRESGNFTGDVQSGDAFGFGVEGVGDLDGDGTPDVAVGAPGDNGEKGGNEGSFYILFLAPDGNVRSSEKFLPGTGPVAVPDSELGIDIANLGDVDGDGVVDLAVGAPLFREKDQPKSGTVWIAFLNADGTVKSTVRVDDEGSGFDGHLDKEDWFGDGVAGIGDLDGDGVPDLAVARRVTTMETEPTKARCGFSSYAATGSSIVTRRLALVPGASGVGWIRTKASQRRSARSAMSTATALLISPSACRTTTREGAASIRGPARCGFCS
jgi:hypothetical protein